MTEHMSNIRTERWDCLYNSKIRTPSAPPFHDRNRDIKGMGFENLLSARVMTVTQRMASGDSAGFCARSKNHDAAFRNHN